MRTDLRTREGVVVGTVPYMSPEQVSGRGETATYTIEFGVSGPAAK